MNVDLVVVGTGEAAQNVAFPCRAAGWTVAVVDSRPFSGTCSLRGCDAKKVLVGVAELVDWTRRMQGRGVSASAQPLVWSDMIRFKRSITDHRPTDLENRFRDAGITAMHGRAHFVGPTTLAVSDETITARHVVIAAGAQHARLGIPGEDLLTTSTAFLELDDLPARVVFVGGGYIAFEFAHIAARAGSAVQILHGGDRPLEAFDADLVGQLVEVTRELGVDIHVGSMVTAIEKGEDELLVSVRSGTGEWQVAADVVVHSAGRVPEVDDLALDAAGVTRAEDGGVRVNEYLQSVSNSAIYAAGDAVANGQFRLTPVAKMQGGIVADNLLHGNTRTPNYLGIPTVVFTTPPLARVGLSESAAAAQGIQFRIQHEDTSSWYSSRRVASENTGYKTVVEQTTGRILGADLLGPHAEEVINIFGFAVRHGFGADDLTDMVYAYPTNGSDVRYMV